MAEITYTNPIPSKIYGVRSIASKKRENLEGLALKVWKEHSLDVALLDIKKSKINEKTVYHAVAVAYFP